jgi:hypothetical protein
MLKDFGKLVAQKCEWTVDLKMHKMEKFTLYVYNMNFLNDSRSYTFSGDHITAKEIEVDLKEKKVKKNFFSMHKAQTSS